MAVDANDKYVSGIPTRVQQSRLNCLNKIFCHWCSTQFAPTQNRWTSLFRGIPKMFISQRWTANGGLILVENYLYAVREEYRYEV